MRKQGLDISYYRVLGEQPETTPVEINFAIVCAIWGTWSLPNFSYNANKMQDIPIRGVYGAYRAYKTGQEMADALISAGLQANAHFLAIDFENYGTYTLSERDIPILKSYYYAVRNAGWPVVVYMGRYRLWFIEQHDPGFAADMQVWLAYPSENPEQVGYGSYNDKIKKPFSDIVFVQYTSKANGADYGVYNVIYKDGGVAQGPPISTLDMNVFTLEGKTLEEWCGIEQEPDEEEDMPEEGVPDGFYESVLEKLDLIISLMKNESPVVEEVEEESFSGMWDGSSPRPTKVDGIPVAYLRISDKQDKAPLLISDGLGTLVHSEVEAFGSIDNHDSMRTIARPGDVIMVRKSGNVGDWSVTYHKSELQHIGNINDDNKAALAYELGGGNLGFLVMPNQVIGGRNISEHPHKDKPLFVWSKYVAEFI